MTGPKTRVLIVDDSALMRSLLQHVLQAHPGIEVVGAAADPIAARQLIKERNPDVVTLDIEMPKMDGLEFLEKIMRLRPMPVVMVSSLTQKGADATLRALELGAVDIVGKPVADIAQGIEAVAAEIQQKVIAAAGARVRARAHQARPPSRVSTGPGYSSTERVIAIGASTGGVEALREVVLPLPADSPAILITQHMPERFTASFADRLNKEAAVNVHEAVDGERVLPGHVYIAPGNHHLELARSGANYVCRLNSGPPVSGHRPSVDVLFRSVANAAGARAIGVILTGMGRDGAAGLLDMHRCGALTLGQDEASSVVYGMPRVAWEAGAVERQLPLSAIADAMLAACGGGARAIRV